MQMKPSNHISLLRAELYKWLASKLSKMSEFRPKVAACGEKGKKNEYLIGTSFVCNYARGAAHVGRDYCTISTLSNYLCLGQKPPIESH